MNRKDKYIAERLRRAFPLQPIHNAELGERIISQLPCRRVGLIYLVINYLLLATGGIVVVVTQWDTIKMITHKILYSPTIYPEIIILHVFGIIILITIMWYINSILDEFHSMENRDIIEHIIKHKQRT